MNNHASRNTALSKPVSCLQCGVEFRNSDSDACSECGAPKIWKKIAYFDWDQFILAAQKLEEAGISIIKSDARIGIGGYLRIVTGHTALSEIWIGKPEIAKALEVLEASGLTVPAPLIDRDEPICPTCNTKLDLDGPTICTLCNEPFIWFDIDEQ